MYQHTQPGHLLRMLMLIIMALAFLAAALSIDTHQQGELRQNRELSAPGERQSLIDSLPQKPDSQVQKADSLAQKYSSGILLQHDQDMLLRFSGLFFAFLAVYLLFHQLTVKVDHEFVQITFGIGIISRKIPLDRIIAATAVRNSWWWGWGIRLIPGGWMWNVSGLQAVELELKNGRKFRIGTDEPEMLASAVKVRKESKP